MPLEHDLSHYLALWKTVEGKLKLAAELDPAQEDKPDLYRHPSRLIFGASSHQYRCRPMPESEIRAYERQYSISLPLNFRSYLLVCGDGSAGPGYGIDLRVRHRKFTEALAVKLAQPCLIEPRQGIGFLAGDSDLSEDEYSFTREEIENGTLEIGTSGNPCTHRLIINGSLQGDMYDDSYDMIFYRKSFEDWYIKWLDETLDQLQSGKAQRQFDRTHKQRKN